MSSVTGITINCNRERCNGGGIFRSIEVDAQHPIYQEGIVVPISTLIDLPLLVYRHPSGANEDMTLSNEIAMKLLLQKDGETVSDFKEKPGSITVVRRDGKPLTRPAIETIWMFNDHFLEHLQEDKRVAERLLNRNDFDHFCEDYREDRILQGNNSFAQLQLPL